MNNPNWDPQNNTQWQPQANTQEQPPSYSDVVNDLSQTGYDNYAQSYSQNPAAYPPQEGYAATAGYDPSKAAYPTQAFQKVDGYPNYYPQQYYPQPAVSNSNQTVLVTQDVHNLVVEPVRDYKCLAVFAILMFLPTGIMALMKASDAQNQYHMGNINKAHECNQEARKYIRISLIIGVVLIILSIVVRVLLTNYYYSNLHY